MSKQIASINNGEITVTENRASCGEGTSALIALGSMALCGLPISPSTKDSYEVKTPDGTSKFNNREDAINFASDQAR